VGAGAAGDDARQRGLADTRWAVQDQIADPIGGNRPAQQSPGTQDPFLAHKVIEPAWAQPIGQGGQTLQQRLAMLLEQISHGSMLLGPSSIQRSAYADRGRTI
jgi:hypothetical protein